MPKSLKDTVEKGVFTPVSPHIVSGLSDFAVSNGVDVGLGDFEPSLARQEFAEECDINVIMARYETTGVINHLSNREPMYVDWTTMPKDLPEALELMMKADDAFMRLPAKVRRQFDNDPIEFVEFATNPDNLDQLREWELAPQAAPEPPKAAPGSAEPPVVAVAPVEPPKGP